MLQALNHLFSLVLPVGTCWFLATGPHDVIAAFAWTLPFWLVLLIDWLGPVSTEQPNRRFPPGFYDGILYILAGLQLANIALMLIYVQQLPWQTAQDVWPGIANLIALRFMVGTSSGTSGIVVAHELIHRRQHFMQLLGRLLLCTVCYDHFVISHKRGHHAHLGLPDDIATARIGESFKQYWQRVYGGYFRYAWQSELTRLGLDGGLMRLELLRSQVVQGLIAEVSVTIFILYWFGWLATLMFLYQAWVAVRILEAVNYFQHWGLAEGRFGQSFAWVTDSWMTRYTLIGLSNHIGHHQNAGNRFQEIAYSDQGPKLPYGYFVMNLWVKLDNPSFQIMALGRLERHRQS